MKNNKYIFLGFCIVTLSLSFVNAQEISKNDYNVLVSKIEVSLNDFPSNIKWSGIRSKPSLSSSLQKKYKTIINQTFEEEPNFNGKYIIVEFGYGSSSLFFFIVDLETGIVIDGMSSEFGLKYSINSKLIIINPMDSIIEYWENDDVIPARCITDYYLFEKNKMMNILKINNVVNTSNRIIE